MPVKNFTYLSERAWGTVREDYSHDGVAWEYFDYDQACSRAYRWNEDGMGGICDVEQRLCLALSLWNGRDPILKERMFGLTGNQGNHGEDVKECFFYLDATPSHSFMRYLYNYPQETFPYSSLVEENRRRSRIDPSFGIIDTNVFAENRYWDVEITYAKETPESIFARIKVSNRGPDTATLHVLPSLWFRNTWSWGEDNKGENPSYASSNLVRKPGRWKHITIPLDATSCMAGNRQKSFSQRTKAIWSGFLAHPTPRHMSKILFIGWLFMVNKIRPTHTKQVLNLLPGMKSPVTPGKKLPSSCC